MAIFHFFLKNGKQGKGKAHCDYIFREGRFGNGKMKEELVFKEAGNIPHWAKSASDFFENADVFERANGNVYTEFEVGLQTELTLDENVELVKKLVNEHIGPQKVWAFAIHEKMATLEEKQRQPHAHIMFSERIITDVNEQVKYPNKFFMRYNPKEPQKGGYKKDKRFAENKHISSVNLSSIRKYWQDINNEAFERKGLSMRISCKSLEAQRQEALSNNDELLAESLERPAQPHLGPKLAGQMGRALKRDDFEIEMLSPKGQLVFLAKALKRIKENIRERKLFIQNLQKEKDTHNEIVQEVESKPCNIYGTELVQRVAQAYRNWNKHFFANRAKIDELKKDVISDEGLEQLSLSIYTKGISTKLAKFSRKIGEQQEAYNLEYEKFCNRPKPKFWQFDAKKNYENEKNRLESWKQKISEDIVYYTNRKSAFDDALSKEENKNRLAIVRNRLALKRASAVKFIEEIEKENKKIVKLKIQMYNLNKIVNRKSKYTVDEGAMLTLEQGCLTDAIKALKKLREEVEATIVAERVRENKMNINLRGRGIDYNSGYDMGF